MTAAEQKPERTREPRTRFRERARIVKSDRANQALLLRRQGVSYRQIARDLGCSVGAAHGLVQRHLARMPAESAAELRQHLLARFEEIYHANADQLDSPPHAMICLRATQAIAVMLGLNMKPPNGGQEPIRTIIVDSQMLTPPTIVAPPGGWGDGDPPSPQFPATLPPDVFPAAEPPPSVPPPPPVARSPVDRRTPVTPAAVTPAAVTARTVTPAPVSAVDRLYTQPAPKPYPADQPFPAGSTGSRW